MCTYYKIRLLFHKAFFVPLPCRIGLMFKVSSSKMLHCTSGSKWMESLCAIYYWCECKKLFRLRELSASLLCTCTWEPTIVVPPSPFKCVS